MPPDTPPVTPPVTPQRETAPGMPPGSPAVDNREATGDDTASASASAEAFALADSLADLAASEAEALALRRRVVLRRGGAVSAAGDLAGGGGNDEGAMATVRALPRVGLALSGGGVRSATFALGLLRGLAQDRSAAKTGAGTGTVPDVAGPPVSGGNCAPPAAPASPVKPAPPPGSSPADTTLAAGGLLGRIDYLSSVSGGGYIASMFGRLVAAHGLAEAQAILADSGSSVLEWLRRNGRYLTPAGSRDTGIAVVTYLRAWLAIHTEFMFACCLVGLVIV